MRNPRYYAKKQNNKGYLYDREFSDKVPMAVETTYELAEAYAKRYNEEEEWEDDEFDRENR